MICNEVKKFISPYLDSVLDSHVNLRIEEHLANCSECQKYYEQEHNLERSFKNALVTNPETDAAWQRALNHATRISIFQKKIPVTIAVSMVLALLLIGGWFRSGFYQSDLAWAAYKNHSKYLADKLPVHIQGMQTLAINEYFRDKLAFNVDIPTNVSIEDFRMLGARSCHLKGVPVAYMVYHYKNIPVSLFLMDSDRREYFKQLNNSNDEIQKDNFFGKTVITYQKGNKIICAISQDVPDETLQKIVLSYANIS